MEDRFYECCEEPSPFNSRSKKVRKETSKQVTSKTPSLSDIQKTELVLLGDSTQDMLELATALAINRDKINLAVDSTRRRHLSSSFFPKPVVAKSVASSSSKKSKIVSDFTIKVIENDDGFNSFKTTAGKQEKEDVTNVLLLTFSVNSVQAIRRINSTWLMRICKNDCSLTRLPLILVGINKCHRVTSTDDDFSNSLPNRKGAIEKAEALASRIGAIGYSEVSFESNTGFDTIHELIAKAANLKEKDCRRHSSIRASSFEKNIKISSIVLNEGFQVKLSLVGDNAGKHSLATTFCNGGFLTPTDPGERHGFEQYNGIVCLFSIHQDRHIFDVPVSIMVTAGKDVVSYEDTIDSHRRLRGVVYKNSDAVLLCFSIDQTQAIHRLKEYWLPEIDHYCFSRKIPVILVGTKTDLRQSVLPMPLVTCSTGQAWASELGVEAFVECSSKTYEGVEDLFDQAVKTVFDSIPFRQSNRFLMEIIS